MRTLESCKDICIFSYKKRAACSRTLISQQCRIQENKPSRKLIKIATCSHHHSTTLLEETTNAIMYVNQELSAAAYQSWKTINSCRNS